MAVIPDGMGLLGGTGQTVSVRSAVRTGAAIGTASHAYCTFHHHIHAHQQHGYGCNNDRVVYGLLELHAATSPLLSRISTSSKANAPNRLMPSARADSEMSFHIS